MGSQTPGRQYVGYGIRFCSLVTQPAASSMVPSRISAVYIIVLCFTFCFCVSRPILSPCVIRLSVSEKPLHSQSLSCFMHIIAITVHERSPPLFIALFSTHWIRLLPPSNGFALMFLEAPSPTRATPALPDALRPNSLPPVPSAVVRPRRLSRNFAWCRVMSNPISHLILGGSHPSSPVAPRVDITI